MVADDEKALRAARAVIHARERALTATPRATASRRPLSIRTASEKYGVTRNKVERAIKFVLNGPGRRPGRPTMFNEEEDGALVAYVDWMQQRGFSAGKRQVESAANCLRRRRDPDAPPVSKIWYYRWIPDHPQFQTQASDVKAVRRARKSSESSDTMGIDSFLATGCPQEGRADGYVATPSGQGNLAVTSSEVQSSHVVRVDEDETAADDGEHHIASETRDASNPDLPPTDIHHKNLQSTETKVMRHR